MIGRNREKRDLLLVKAAQVWPLLDTVSRRGGAVVSLCHRAGLPLDDVREKRGVVGERSAWRFLGYASKALGLEHLGYIAAVEHPVQSTGEVGGLRVRMAPSLGRLLEFFIEDIHRESAGTYYSLRRDGELTWFHREVIFPHCVGRWQLEQYFSTALIQIIRLCAGESWLPPKLHLASSDRPLSVPDEWSDIDIEWGHKATEVAIENHLMALPSPEAYQQLDKCHDRNPQEAITVLDIEYLVDRQIWAGGTGIEETAHEIGLSVRTLKRRLRENGKVYSTVVISRRQYWAEKLLAETNTPVGDIARTLGYRHLSNFTRAFSRQAGFPPQVFRQRAMVTRD
jgi:AraC-like DNA-binding protein